MLCINSLCKDIINLILEYCIDYSNGNEIVNMYSSQPTLMKHIYHFSLTCKRLNHIAQIFINSHTYTYNIYQKSIERPDIHDHNGVVYYPHPIGNNIWFVSVKQTGNKFIFVDELFYSHYQYSDRYFEQNRVIMKGIPNETTNYYRSLVKTRTFTIHYKANYGEVLLLTWYYNHPHSDHYHVKMTWTEGDVWVAVVDLPRDSLMYRYEVCIDNGGPIIRKENKYRGTSLFSNQECDLWNMSL